MNKKLDFVVACSNCGKKLVVCDGLESDAHEITVDPCPNCLAEAQTPVEPDASLQTRIRLCQRAAQERAVILSDLRDRINGMPQHDPAAALAIINEIKEVLDDLLAPD